MKMRATHCLISLLKKLEQLGLFIMKFQILASRDIFQYIIQITGNRLIIIGLGPSAHSFNGYSRQWNIRDLKGYIKSVNNNRPFFEREELDVKTRFNEYIMTSLRTMWGIDLEYVEKTFEKEGYDYIVNLAGKFKDYGLMKHEKKSLVLTNQGKMISDNIISEFMMPGDE